ncbi:hypothetical protein W02_03880 [Nitrospira sp. KM1]|uniref:type II secretion system protein GspG n=1 Tax=Nitrospira sp. KM1 TaxID=1936990 RepID=UPI0013A7AAAE|nr:type II secretion system protein GspG [Nitrospira sp. KM1]BCA53248.1 hypothetical protein W02_03880 [Nitrospira sp. KM1]
MAPLRNAQRTSYKATYCQISPAQTGDVRSAPPTAHLTRAVEKAAFVQALRIVAPELAALPRQSAAITSSLTAEHQAQLPEAYKAIARLIADQTGTSTLNSAALFAAIAPATLIAIAQQLAAYRAQMVESITKSVAEIVVAYRAALVVPSEGNTGSPTARKTADPKGATVQTGESANGLPIITSVTPLAAAKAPSSARTKTAGAKSKLELRGQTVSITIDESRPLPEAFSSSLAADAGASYQPSNAAAIGWAEKAHPRLFSSLAQQLQPYLGVTLDERAAAGNVPALLGTLQSVFATVLNPTSVGGAINGFQSRMMVEPVGNLHLERVEMCPAGVERGELANSVPLAPGETVNISHKEWSITEREFEDIVQDFFEGYSEQGVAEKNDIAMSTDSQSQHATALNVGASLSASYGAVTLSTNFGYSATSNDTRSKKDSRNHSMEITKKASARTKKDHKVTFKVSSVVGSEDQSVRVISNPSATDTMRIDYFQLARKWKVDLLRYGLRMTYDIVIPNPGAGIVRLVEDVKKLDALIGTPFSFTLPLTAIYYNSLATDPHLISNYDTLAAQYNAAVTAPPEARKWVNVHKETQPVNDYDNVHFDSIDFDIDENYYIYTVQFELNYQRNEGDTRSFLLMLGSETLSAGLNRLIGMSGHLSIDFMYQYVYNYAINITFICRPKVQVLLDWRLQVWGQIRQAAEEQYNKNLQNYRDEQAKLTQQIADFDALTLRRMEREEIMKGVLRWLLGPQFYLVPFNLSGLFGSDASHPGVGDVLDPNRLTEAEWISVLERGEFIKYLHNAIEWENVLYFTYPYFWDDNKLWDFKKFLYHPDPTHRMFLRSGAARVVLTIRSGFESSFTSLIESGSFGSLPGPHPYVTIAQEIQNFANTNYPGFPPANPEQNARPLLFLEQRRVWREMQYMIQLLNACKAATGSFPAGLTGNTIPVAALTAFLDGPVVINGTTYNGINDYNTQANNQQLALDPATPQEALLSTYTSVPATDVTWGHDYYYKCPGDSGDYDLICFGADGVPGGADKNADISANAEASLISTWFEYTPTGAMDIGVTVNPPNIVPPQPSAEIA